MAQWIVPLLIAVSVHSASGALLGDVAPVQEARKLLLAKERLAAVQVLQTASEDPAFTAERTVILKEIENAKSLFFTNDGQKLYEQAESARFSGEGQPVPRYQEALKLEAYHVKILEGLVIAHLAQQDCQQAVSALSQLKEIDADGKGTFLLELMSKQCDGKAGDLPSSAGNKIEEFGFYEKVVRARQSYERGQADQAIRFADEALQLDRGYPSAYFWGWKARVSAGNTAEAAERAERYVELCRGNVTALRRQYRFDPWICRGVEEVREYLDNLDKGGST